MLFSKQKVVPKMSAHVCRIATMGFLAVLSLSCVTAAPAAPPWMLDLKQSYPESKYLAAVGSGDSRRDAESDASGSLALIFKATVKIDSNAQRRYMQIVSENKTLSQNETSIAQNVDLQSNAQFLNLRFSDPYTDPKGKVSVVAYLERDPTAALYRTIIQKNIDLTDKLSARAEQEKGILYKFALLDSAVQVSLHSDLLLGQLQIISAPAAKLLAMQVDSADLAAKRDDAAKNITYKLSIDGDEDGKIGAIVDGALSGLKLARQSDGALAITGSWATEPVAVNPTFKSLHWSLKLALSDESGTAIATYFKEYRENAISDEQAKAFAFRSVDKMVRADFVKAITDYMTRISQVGE
jgi:hypothetical protein